ncbi:hypothetical protein MSSIH_1848 [Methanosarcina siciliae HI350]|uniref:Uncharacterized protein n=1 Tax=Methanosarcina siciliae HI350 TaxID=1434119 RepID=A0A0E3PEA6_9EURY|nr:hypothetical protein [Methanosarcina siciliae]AKB32538.1 hypothetical protein MSSIH_1848 [Methanosarcina siciliae HI350]
MFWSKDDIVERLSKIPRTLEDISIEIFEGVSPSKDLLYKMNLSEYCTDAPNGYRYLQTNISAGHVGIEKELVYPYMDDTLSNEFAVQPTQHHYILPYEILGYEIKKEYRIFQPEELKTKFPVAYNKLLEGEKKYGSVRQEIESDNDYRLENESLLKYVKTPKIIITNHYRFHASYDAIGNYVFAGGVGVVLGDVTLYHYVTAVLNSAIARTLPEIWHREKMQKNHYLNAKMMRRFPIEFPKKEITETLISTITRYLIYLNRQKQEAKTYSIHNCQNLIDFYKRISDLLILDTYITDDLDPRFLEILAEHITVPGDEFEYSNDISLLIGLQEIKQNILNSEDFRKCRFTNEFTNILATLKNNGVW